MLCNATINQCSSVMKIYFIMDSVVYNNDEYNGIFCPAWTKFRSESMYSLCRVCVRVGDVCMWQKSCYQRILESEETPCSLTIQEHVEFNDQSLFVRIWRNKFAIQKKMYNWVAILEVLKLRVVLDQFWCRLIICSVYLHQSKRK